MPFCLYWKLLDCLRKLLKKCKHCACKCHRFKCAMSCEDVESDCCQDPPVEPTPPPMKGEIEIEIEEEKEEKEQDEKKEGGVTVSTETSQTNNLVYPVDGGDGPAGVVVLGEIPPSPAPPATPSPGAPVTSVVVESVESDTTLSLTPRRRVAGASSSVTSHLM